MSVFVALGSNLDDPPRRLIEALAAFLRQPQLRLIRWSSLYRTKPWGYAEQPDYCDAVCEIETDLPPHDLLLRLQKMEKDLGREPLAVRWGPRRIDLDLLLYDQQQINEVDLTVPHPLIRERAFVLVPLLEIAPELADPLSGTRYAEDLARVRTAGDVVKIQPPPTREALECITI